MKFVPSFPTLRPHLSLNGLWDFAFLGEINPETFKPDSAAFTEKMYVPSVFDIHPSYLGKRGVAIYHKTFETPVGHPIRMVFGAVSMWCRIYVDKKLVAENACGYVPITIDVPASDFQAHEVLVLVDNRFNFERVPMHDGFFDFYQHGGILRDVDVDILPKDFPFLDTVQVIPTNSYREGEVSVTVSLGGKAALPSSLKFQFDHAAPFMEVVASEKTTFTFKVPSPRIWSPETPNLHLLTVSLLDDKGVAKDDFVVRFGLRKIEAKKGAIWLNGEKIKLKGYNRHEWHPSFGSATPESIMVSDIHILKDLGCNFVRGCHYPQSQKFLDYCDEYGLLIWEENLGWGQKEKTFASEKFHEDHEKSLRSMVRASINHPCIIMWGFLNEAATNEECARRVFERTCSVLRELDPSRLVTYATMHPKADKYYDLADVISFNNYPGWYGCDGIEKPLDMIEPQLRDIIAHIDSRGYSDKPIFISEIGAEGIYGWRDSYEEFYTEQYQAKHLGRSTTEALTNPRCSGIALWHFSDARTYGGSQGNAMARPRCFNNKGTLDEYRRPKESYKVVKNIFRTLGK